MIKKFNESKGFIETLDGDNSITDLLKQLDEIWKDWKNSPLTKPTHIKPASKELKDWINNWINKTIK